MVTQQKSDLENEIETVKSALCSKIETTKELIKEKEQCQIGFNTLKEEMNSLLSLRKSLEEKVVETESKLEVKQIDFNNLKVENDNLLDMKLELQEMNQNLVSSHNAEVDSFKMQVETLQEQADAEKQDFNFKLSELQQKHESEKENVKVVDESSLKSKLTEIAESKKLVEAEKEEILLKLNTKNTSMQTENKALKDKIDELSKINENDRLFKNELKLNLEVAESEKKQIETDCQKALKKIEMLNVEKSTELNSLKESYEVKLKTLHIMTEKHQENERSLK